MVGGGQGNDVNDGVDGVPDFSTIITQQLQNLLPTILAQVATKVAIKGTLEIKTVMPSMTTSRAMIERYIYGLSLQIYGMVAAKEPETIHVVVQKARTLTHEAVRNGSLKKNPEKRRNGGEPNRDRNVRDGNKRTKTGKDFATTTNPVRREYNGTIPKCISCNLHHPPKMPCQAFINCGRPRHMEKDCRVAPRTVNPMNAKNPTAAPGACYEYGGTDHLRQHVLGMDWLSNHKAEIICHEKVVRIPLQDGQVLRVIREIPKEKMRHLMSAKAKEQKHEEIVLVRDIPEVFLDDLSGLPPIREIKFCIELIPGAIPVMKSPY
nr:putative reverse transcriptase domain-containing protein [Tanacetum cinerariifolium]